MPGILRLALTTLAIEKGYYALWQQQDLGVPLSS
jgi:hypothetical protein